MVTAIYQTVESLTALPTAVVFDFDGTLGDTMPIHWLAWVDFAKKYSLHFPIDLFYSWGGVPTGKIIRDLFAAKHALMQEKNQVVPDSIDVKALSDEKEELYKYYVKRDPVKPIKPIVALAHHYYAKKVPLAVCSGGCTELVQHGLKSLGIAHMFSVLVCAEDVKCGKPDPEPYLNAAKGLGISPSSCIGYEDTDIGLQSIKNAGFAQAIDIRTIIK